MQRLGRFLSAWPIRLVCASVLAAAVVPLSSLAAQQIDPSVLARIQGQLGAATSSSRALDDAREGAVDDQTQLPTTVTPEEQELRRQLIQAELAQSYVPTPIEREYRERLDDPTLRQFGYDLFRSTSTSSGPLTGEVGGNYVLGIGDEIVVSFQGATNDSQTVRVNREGYLVVGQLRPVRAAGRSLASVRADLVSLTRRTLLGTEVYVSVGGVRSISVFVGGEVQRPGQYQFTSLGDVATALARAGGLRRNGSLRNIRIVRSGGGTTIVDLYGLLGIGTPSSVRLQDGDRVIVPVIGGTAAITGAVARPGIYEVRPSTTLADLIAYAGGALRPRGFTSSISRIAADGTETFVSVTSGSQGIVTGDAVQVVGGSAGGAQNRVALRGFVQNQGPRPLAVARTVRDLLGSPEDLQLGTYLPMAVLVRRDPVTSARVYEPVNLITALRNGPSVPLRSDDRLYVFSQADIRFMNNLYVRRVVLGERNPLPHCRSLDRLAAYVRDTQSARFTAITRGSFIVERDGRGEVVGGSAVRSGTASRSTDAQTGVPNRGQLNREQAAAAGLAGAAGAAGSQQGEQDQAGQAEQRVDEEGRPAARGVDPGTGLPFFCPPTFEEEPELLAVLLESAVSVGGAVRQPGAYPIAAATPAAAVVSVAQGLTIGATDIVLDVTRSSGGDADTRRVAIGDDRSLLASVDIRPGDDLRVNSAQPQFEAGGVLLSGEFKRPGLYSIRKGETLAQLIERAGGVTRFAYPYGAVFTRRSVKELQREGFARTARELNTGLLAAIGRRGAQGESIAAASELVDKLASVEAPGRMVIEADPQVLAVRPELDTVLEAGDAIVMPKTPNFVLALGDVSNPGALQFVAGKQAIDYVREAGGTQATADDDRAFLVLPNGTARPLDKGMWKKASVAVPPGSTIVVPKDIDPLRSLDIVRDIATIIGQFATAIASVAILATN